MNEARAKRVRAERAAERRVLEAVECGPLFGIEIEPDEHRAPGGPKPITEATVRCEASGWIKMGRASSRDPRIHMTERGRAELARWRTHIGVANERGRRWIMVWRASELNGGDGTPVCARRRRLWKTRRPSHLPAKERYAQHLERTRRGSPTRPKAPR